MSKQIDIEEELQMLRQKSKDDELIKKKLKGEIHDLKVELKQMRSTSLILNETVTDEELFWEQRRDFE